MILQKQSFAASEKIDFSIGVKRLYTEKLYLKLTF